MNKKETEDFFRNNSEREVGFADSVFSFCMAVFVSAIVVKLCWNAVIPEVTGFKEITLFQSFLINVILGNLDQARIFFLAVVKGKSSGNV